MEIVKHGGSSAVCSVQECNLLGHPWVSTPLTETGGLQGPVYRIWHNTQWLKTSVAKPDDLSLTFGIHIVEEQTEEVVPLSVHCDNAHIHVYTHS